MQARCLRVLACLYLTIAPISFSRSIFAISRAAFSRASSTSFKQAVFSVSSRATRSSCSRALVSSSACFSFSPASSFSLLHRTCIHPRHSTRSIEKMAVSANKTEILHCPICGIHGDRLVSLRKLYAVIGLFCLCARIQSYFLRFPVYLRWIRVR